MFVKNATRLKVRSDNTVLRDTARFRILKSAEIEHCREQYGLLRTFAATVCSGPCEAGSRTIPRSPRV